jgi:hypothetical protein
MQFCPSGPCFCLPVITSTSLPSTCRSSVPIRSTSGLEIQLCKRRLKLFRDCYFKANCTYCLIALAAGYTFSSASVLKTDWPTAVKQMRDPVSCTGTTRHNYELIAVAESTVIASLRGVGELRHHDLLNVDCSDLNELYGL